MTRDMSSSSVQASVNLRDSTGEEVTMDRSSEPHTFIEGSNRTYPSSTAVAVIGVDSYNLPLMLLNRPMFSEGNYWVSACQLPDGN